MRHECRFHPYDATLLIAGTTPALTEHVRRCRALLLFPDGNRTRYEMRRFVRSLDELADPRRLGGQNGSIPISLSNHLQALPGLASLRASESAAHTTEPRRRRINPASWRVGSWHPFASLRVHLNHDEGLARTGASPSRGERDRIVVRTANAPNTLASVHQKAVDEKRMPPVPSITLSDR